MNYVLGSWITSTAKIDPTFIASVFTGVLATFGVQTAKKSADGTMKMQNGGAATGGGGITKADLERLIAAASQTAPSQTIRVEQGPIKIVTDSDQPVKPTRCNHGKLYF